MTGSESTSSFLDMEADPLAGLAERKGGIPIESLSKNAQELFSAVQELGSSYIDIKLQKDLGWDANRYEAARAELIVSGNEEFQRITNIDSISTEEVENNIQATVNTKIQKETWQNTETKSSDPDASTQALEQEDTPSPKTPYDFAVAAMSIGSTSYEEDEKNCIIAILFIRILSDLFENVRRQSVESFVEQGMSPSLSKEYAEDESMYEQVFFVPKSARWSHISSLNAGITAEDYKACHELENTHPSIKGALSSITYFFQPSLWGLRDADLSELVKLISSLDFNSSIESLDFFANTCDELESIYAQASQEIGDRSIEMYKQIPSSASRLLITLLKPREHMRIYDRK